MILIGGMLVLIVSGALVLSMMLQKVPDIHALRNDPALFNIADYKDKIALHTRISTLFPRGTTRENIDAFMVKAGYEPRQNEGQRCTYSTDFDTIRYIYGLNDDRLVSVHILDGENIWPEYRESCLAAAQELTPTEPQNEAPIILPLQPLDTEN